MDKSGLKISKVPSMFCARCRRILDDGSVGYRTFKDGATPTHYVCLPCQEGKEPVHLHCSCPPPAVGEVSSHREGCHVPIELERRDQEHLTRMKTTRGEE